MANGIEPISGSNSGGGVGAALRQQADAILSQSSGSATSPPASTTSTTPTPAVANDTKPSDAAFAQAIDQVAFQIGSRYVMNLEGSRKNPAKDSAEETEKERLADARIEDGEDATEEVAAVLTGKGGNKLA